MSLRTNFNRFSIVCGLSGFGIFLSNPVFASVNKIESTVSESKIEKPAEFFDGSLAEIKKLNQGDESAVNANETIKLYNKNDFKSCANKAAADIKKYETSSVFFNFEFAFGVKCIVELHKKKQLTAAQAQEWAKLYLNLENSGDIKAFHGAEMNVFLDHVLSLSEVLFQRKDDLSLDAKSMNLLATNLQRSKNSQIKKDIFLFFINKNDETAAKDFLAYSDPDLTELSTLEILNDHYKDEVYASRIADIKKSKSEAQELKRLYQRNQYHDFLSKNKVTILATESEKETASRQMGWLYVRGKQDFKDKVVQEFDSLNINPHTFFWILSNQGMFKDIITTYDKLSDKKKTLHYPMLLKAHIYSGQYEAGYKFLKKHGVVEDLDKQRPAPMYYSSLLLIRNNKDKEALDVLNALIRRDTDYKLQAMYLKYNILKDQKKKEYLAVAKDIVNFYPLTFYGLYIAHNDNLTSELPFINRDPLTKLNFNFQALEESRKLKHLIFLFDYKMDHKFRKFIETTINSLGFESQVIWAYKYKVENQPLNAIKLMNQVWTSRRDLIHPSIIPIAYPRDYLEAVKKHSVPGIDPYLVLALIRQESAFQKNAQSPANARGLMQLLTGTAKEMARSLRMSSVSLPWGLYTPEINIKLGSFYLRKRVEAYKGHVPLALASYNVGPGRLQKWSVDRNTISEAQEDLQSSSWKVQDLWVEEMPWEETRFYVKAVLRNYLLYVIFEDYAPLKDCYRVWNCEAKSRLENTVDKSSSLLNSAKKEAKSQAY